MKPNKRSQVFEEINPGRFKLIYKGKSSFSEVVVCQLVGNGKIESSKVF